MPPWTWSADEVTRATASEHQHFAVDAATEASACKLYAAQACMEVTLEAVQLFGGNGYMAEFQVEQLCRDAKVLQIYAGTDEIQVSQIARNLLARAGG